jgi:hypothetical protein
LRENTTQLFIVKQYFSLSGAINCPVPGRAHYFILSADLADYADYIEGGVQAAKFAGFYSP